MYTVKQLAQLAGVSVRTLHHYDHIGLLKPSAVGENSYRYYGESDLLRLQQILFFRELDLELSRIKHILDGPDFDLVSALQSHRVALQTKIERLHTLIATLDTTVLHLAGDIRMAKKKKMFAGFSAEKQEQYQQEAARRYGEDTVKQSVQRWNSYSAEQQQQVKDEGAAIYLDMVDAMPSGQRSEQTQAVLVRWHENIRHFYEPSLEVLGGLGETYRHDPDFRAFFTTIHPDLPDFFAEAIAVYVDELETAWLQQELGILEE